MRKWQDFWGERGTGDEAEYVRDASKERLGRSWTYRIQEK